MAEPIYLVDGSGYIFRAFYAVQALSNRAGFPTNALFGFTRMLLKLLSAAKSDQVVAIFDAGRETFRNELYAEYKANRAACPPDLAKQMPYFREFTRALGLVTLELKGYEADDLIATLTRRLSAAGQEVVIVSADKDLMQLVDDRVKIWDTMRDRWFGRAEVIEKFGVPPEQVVEVLGLMGDSSDNVPGLNGVGPKTAEQLIQKFQSVEGVIAAIAEIGADASIRGRKKIVAELESNVDLLRLSRRLVEVDSKVPLMLLPGLLPEMNADAATLDSSSVVGAQSSEGGSAGGVLVDQLGDAELLARLARRTVDSGALSRLIEEFEFGTLLRDFPGAISTTPKAPESKFDYRTVFAPEFEKWVAELRKQSEFALDTETTSLSAQDADIVGVSFCWADDHAYYIPLKHVGAAPEAQVSWEDFVRLVGPILRDPAIKKIGQNLKFDCSILGERGAPVEGVSFDTMLASYVLNPDKATHNLSALAHEYLGRKLIEFEEVLGVGSDFRDVPIDKATEYGGQDAHCTWLIAAKLKARLIAENLLSVHDTIEVPLVSILSRMERRGVRIDTALLAAMSDEFAQKLGAMESEIYKLAGTEFNINSPKQLSEILFTKLGLPTAGLKRTKTGTSTDSGVLEKLSDRHPLPAFLLEYRQIHKLKSTYVDALPLQVSAKTGRIHSRFNQTGTGTGRLSSSDPNLQNIPIQSAEGQRIRSAFVPESGSCLISADYSQIELRLLAHMSGDENLIQAFKNNIDVHAQTARTLLGLAPDAVVTPELRRIGKTLNFGIVYGMSGFRLARELGVPMAVGNRYLEDYFANFPRVREFFDRLEAEVEERGVVTTMFGRRRVMAEIDSAGRDRGFLMRAALNAPIQGSAADLIKLAMIRVDREIRERRLPIDMILQVHDELVFECPVELEATAREIIVPAMEQVVELLVPLKVEIQSGLNWQEAHG